MIAAAFLDFQDGTGMFILGRNGKAFERLAGLKGLNSADRTTGTEELMEQRKMRVVLPMVKCIS